MTGADVKRLVEEGLEALAFAASRPGMAEDAEMLLAALAPCVVLTAEEAAELRGTVERFGVDTYGERDRAIALLAPESGE